MTIFRLSYLDERKKPVKEHFVPCEDLRAAIVRALHDTKVPEGAVTLIIRNDDLVPAAAGATT